MTDYITCDKHGRTPAHAACVHISEKYNAGVKSGFIFVYDEDDCVNAMCSKCDAMLDEKYDGDMANVPTGGIPFSMYCSGCIKSFADFNGVEIDR